MVESLLKSPISVLGSRLKGSTSDGLGCTYYCGEEDAKSFVVSKFLKNNQKLFSKVLKLRKDVADYCFFDDGDLDQSETIVDYGAGTTLNQKDLLSLLPSEPVDPRVIESWAVLLNYIAHTETSGPTLMFFGIGHVEEVTALIERESTGTQVDTQQTKLYEDWDEFISKCGTHYNLDADLIFLPLQHQDHYFCICINFPKKKVEVLDNQEYQHWKKSNAYHISRLLAPILSDYLEHRGVKRAGDIGLFEVEEVKFPWRSHQENNEENDCFLMMHMIAYEGDLYESELGKKVSRRLFCLEICAALVLADINQIRSEVINKVKEFNVRKQAIWPAIKANRDEMHEGKKPRSKTESNSETPPKSTKRYVPEFKDGKRYKLTCRSPIYGPKKK